MNTEADAFAGDGLCSLRKAITSANADASTGECAAGSGADVISLPAGFYSLTTAGADENANATGDLNVTGDLTIQGGGAANTTIDGALQDRVLAVPTGVTVSLDGVTISGGRGVPGGAGAAGNPTGFVGGPGRGGGGILNAGTLTITNSVVEDNATGAGGSGGAGTATAAGASGTGGAGGPAGQGGGIYNSGTLDAHPRDRGRQLHGRAAAAAGRGPAEAVEAAKAAQVRKVVTAAASRMPAR